MFRELPRYLTVESTPGKSYALVDRAGVKLPEREVAGRSRCPKNWPYHTNVMAMSNLLSRAQVIFT